MNREQKKSYISEMTAKFEDSEAVLVAHYQGLTVKQLDELRAEMRKHGIQFKVTKADLIKSPFTVLFDFSFSRVSNIVL